MDALVFVNYVLLAISLTLVTLELGIALLFLKKDERWSRAMDYIAPIWEITGTFIIFFIVNLAATYPDLLPIIDTMYSGPILVFAILLILRNAFLAYSEISGNDANTGRMRTIYSISTIIAVVIALSVLTSALSGSVASVGSSAANILYVFVNLPNVLLIAAALLITVFITLIFFSIKSAKLLYSSLMLSAALAAAAIVAYLPAALSNILAYWYSIVPAAALLAVMLALYLKDDMRARFIVPVFLFTVFLTFEMLSYPNIFNGAVNLNSYLAPQASRYYISAITVIGGVFLTAAMAYFIYIQRLRRKV